MFGADFMATGHYCRIEKEKSSNIFQVLKGADRSKDQSYVFWKLDQPQLSHIRTPLGNFTKENIKKMSMDFIPLLASKDESQDICFIPDQNYRDFMGKKATSIKEGKIINADLNAALNILKKGKPNTARLGYSGVNTPKRTYLFG